MPKRKPSIGAQASAANAALVLQPAGRLVSARILILANLLRRAAASRYRRLLRLTGSEWGVIMQIGFGAPQTLNQVANGMGLEKAQLSRTVSTLVRRHLVSKKTNPKNSREVLIWLTRGGRIQYQTIRTAGGTANDQLLIGLSDRDRKLLIQKIERLTERARELLKVEQARGPT
ncbi:MAG TPA: MarR family transcriptional regulator [Xanthobacteraceae bacterium]|nr:MarR family transcriptional regulator [Xanthobacteraceae bacterium]